MKLAAIRRNVMVARALNTLAKTFASSYSVPHGQDLLWNLPMLWIDVVANSITAAACYSSLLLLIYFILKRRDASFRWIFWIFGGFILSSGTTHLLDVVTASYPA